MIKLKITVKFRDDKQEKFEAVEAFVASGFYRIMLSREETLEIPVETIERIYTKQVWKKRHA